MISHVNKARDWTDKGFLANKFSVINLFRSILRLERTEKQGSLFCTLNDTFNSIFFLPRCLFPTIIICIFSSIWENVAMNKPRRLFANQWRKFCSKTKIFFCGSATLYLTLHDYLIKSSHFL